MKKPTINFSWPVVLSDFTQDNENEKFSRGKLNVFYKGLTADNRRFSDEFAEKVVASLPYTPVVSYYDEETEDFIGHASEQNVYGLVDPCVKPEFKELEDGKTWCVCDVVLYTERPDKTGEIASKIIGQPHSLELDPKTVEYVINYDEKKHFKDIEFTAGQFVGVSVLGKKQKPAFTGSGFFGCDENFEAKMQTLREYCENTNKENVKENGGDIMDLNEFMTLSWGEISSKVDTAIAKEYEHDAYTYVVDMYADYAIARFWYYVEGCSKLMKINYTCDAEGTVTLGNIVEVHVVYEEIKPATTTTDAEINMKQIEETSIDAVDSTEDLSISNPENAATDDVEDDKDDKDDKDDVEDKDDDNKDNKDDEEDKITDHVENPTVTDCTTEDTVVTTSEEPAQVLNVEITPTQMEASVEDEQTTNEETNSSSTSFTESEREEFETLKREKKVNLLNSYKESLTEDEYNHFLTAIDSFTDASLELELLKAYKRAQEENNTSEKTIRAFAFAPVKNAVNEDPLDAFVNKYRK